MLCCGHRAAWTGSLLRKKSRTGRHSRGKKGSQREGTQQGKEDGQQEDSS